MSRTGLGGFGRKGERWREQRVFCVCRRSLPGPRPLLASALLRSASAATVRRLMATLPPAEPASRSVAYARISGSASRPSRSSSGASTIRSSPKRAAWRLRATRAETDPRDRSSARISDPSRPMARRDVAREGERRFWLCAGARREKAQATTPTSISPRCTRRGGCCPTTTIGCATHSNERAHHRRRGRRDPPSAHQRTCTARPGRHVPLRRARRRSASRDRGRREIWVAIATQAADGRFVDERLRDVLFRLVFDAAGAELSEPRADWPSGELAWFEVARLGLREAD